MKRGFVFTAFGLMAVFLCGAYYCPSPFWQQVLINAATSFMALAVALIFVNIYLERDARQGAVRSLLVLSHQSIAEFHNALLHLGWAKFGRDKWGDIGSEYIDAGRQPSALRQEVRDFLYDLAKSNKEVQNKLDKLLETLTELSRMVGWDLDPELLEACLDSRIAISKLKDVVFDDSDEARESATEHLLDADINSQIARHMLMSIAGISDDD